MSHLHLRAGASVARRRSPEGVKAISYFDGEIASGKNKSALH